MRRPEPTSQELHAAWQRSRTPTWPATFEEAMADATLSRLVRINAMHPPRAHRKPSSPPLQSAQPLRSTAASLPPAGPAPGYVDRKRAAAGERDDD